jgi:hypothetical protein
MSLPIDRRAVHEIGLTLAQLDPHGATLTPGVTSIATAPGGRQAARAVGPTGGGSDGLSRSVHPQ